MSAKLQKWGNSLGVRIPKSVLEKMNLRENSEVEIEHKNGAIIIFPAEKQFLLETLIGQITKDNLHQEENIQVVGKEVW